MNNFLQITPFLHVPDLKAALAFFNDVLGFQTQFRQANYAYVAREGTAVRILESRRSDGSAFPAHGGFAYYVDVRDVDGVAEELGPKLRKAGVAFHGPVDQPYGQRELIISAPDGNKFVFGQARRPA